jgi:hypothetical protein
VARHRFHSLGFQFQIFLRFGCRVAHSLICLLIHNAWMFEVYFDAIDDNSITNKYFRLPVLATPKTPSLQFGTPQPQTATPLSSRTEAQSKTAEDSVPATPKGDLAGKRAIPSGQFIEVSNKTRK